MSTAKSSKMHEITRRKPCLLERKQKCKKGLDDITSAKGENFFKNQFSKLDIGTNEN